MKNKILLLTALFSLLPTIDSDEEIITTKFEISKMDWNVESMYIQDFFYYFIFLLMVDVTFVFQLLGNMKNLSVAPSKYS